MKQDFDYSKLLGEENRLLSFPSLYEASVNEFSLRKFADASLNDILKNAKMSKGSLYHHFGDKFGLYLCLMDVIGKKKVAYFLPLLKSNENSGDFFGTIRLIINGNLNFMEHDYRLHFLFNKMMEDKMVYEKVLSYFHFDYNDLFGNLITSAIENGQISKEFSRDFIARIINILLSNSHKLIDEGSNIKDSVKVVENLMKFIKTGISTEVKYE